MAESKLVLNRVEEGREGGSPVGSRPAQTTSQDLQKLMLRLKGEFIAEDGRGVDYSALRGSCLFREYREKALQLRAVDVASMDVEERKCFFINLYNCLTIHGLAGRDAPPASVLDVAGFWRSTCYDIGGLVYSLDDMEHGVLRGNRPHPSMSTSTYFEPDDPRSKFCLPALDPRIHFALVCGAKSCPPIQVYSTANLDRGLTAAAKNFCSQEVVLEKDSNVQLSKIFVWYAKDFGENEHQILQWILPFLEGEHKVKLEALLNSGNKITLEPKEYNWMLNKL